MSNLVIVAIPAEDDIVWEISSEKVPHITLLFLGESDNNPNVPGIVEFVQHAIDVSEHGPFMLDVDYRGELGPDKADVVFFQQDRSIKWISQFRSQLLQNPQIKSAYDSVPQYEEWKPHLTLGYPAAPAKTIGDGSDKWANKVDWVSFDRIAVWDADFAGPEFRLRWPERDNGFDDSVGWSDKGGASVQTTEDKATEFLNHHGVKGMRWGVRKETVSNAAGRVASAAKRAGVAVQDHAFEKQTASNEVGSKLQTKIIGEANAKLKSEDLPRINAKPEYVKASKLTHRLKNPLDETTRKYRGEVKAAYIGRLEESANAMKNASGTRQYTIRERGIDLPAEGGNLPSSKYHWEVTTRAVKHADSAEEMFTLEVVMDADGFITDLKPVDNADTMAQSAELGEAFLAHYGVKGMHWGQRKSTPSAVAPTAHSVVPQGAKAKTKIKTEGGENHPAHEDAIKVAEAKSKLKKSGPAALSNKELRDVATRMQLEGQVKQLTASGGQKFVGNLLKNQGQQQANRFIQKKAQEKF